MIRGNNRGLWWYFVSMVFVIILFFVVILSALAFLYIRVGHNTIGHRNMFPPLLTTMLFSLVIGTTISIMVGKKFWPRSQTSAVLPKKSPRATSTST